jgi:AbrB family looped-hinge helix DNA binding protein
MVAQTHFVRVQEKGQVTLPAKIRERLGIKKGDLVGVVETSEGALITRQEVVAANTLDRIGEALRERGVTIDELIESGRGERDQLLREHYGIDPDGP